MTGMKTIIELYDERPLENVLGTEAFRPETTVFLCPDNIARDRKLHRKLEEYFRRRGVDAKLVFRASSLLDTDQVVRAIGKIASEFPECALDISGGTDAALFAGGIYCAGAEMPVYTYSRRRNTFFEISRAPFARDKKCEIQLSVEDCILMAGGSVRQGRVDNAILGGYMDIIDPMFEMFLDFRRDWVKIVTYIQSVSQPDKDGEVSLEAKGDYTVPGPHGRRISANTPALYRMQTIDLIHDLSIEEDERVRFTFRDKQVRTWLRDIGSVLELYVYKACIDTGAYNDVRTSVVVDWEGENKPDAVTNEIDVMASRDVMPLFISCKTSDVKTDALNELAILRDRFGGQTARAAVVTAEIGHMPMRNRAAELNIDVIDLSDLKAGAIRDRLRAFAASRYDIR